MITAKTDVVVCSDDDDNVPIIEPEDFGYKVCNKHTAFDEIPGDGSETSLTGEVRRVQVSAVHTETGEHVEAFLGGLGALHMEVVPT